VEYQRATKSAQAGQSRRLSPSSWPPGTLLKNVKEHPFRELQRARDNQAALNIASSMNTQVDTPITQALIGPCFGQDFSQIPIRPPAAGMIQAKLTINKAGDDYEQEADRISAQVSAAPGPAAVRGTSPHIRRFAGKSNGQMDAARGSVDRALASPGRELEPVLRQDMEQRFNYDFSKVRVHSGAAAEQSARDVNARAYTVGHDIVFGAGRFAPRTREGRRLIAHELTHVVQQAASNANLVLRAPGNAEGTEANIEILGASGSTSETVVLYHYGDLEGIGSFSSRPGYPRLTDCDIATNQAEAARYTGAPISDRLAYKYELRIDRAYFEKNFTNTGTRGAYSEFVTKQPIPAKYFRRVLKLTPAPVKPPAVAVSGVIPRPGSGGVSGGRGQLTTAAEAEAGAAKPALSAAAHEVAQVAKPSGLRTAGRFLAREAPGIILQLVIMALFPPTVNIHNDEFVQLSRAKFDPAVQDALAKQSPMFDKLLRDNASQSIYANVTAGLDYRVDGSSSGDLELYLKDVTFLDMKITNEYVALSDPKFLQTGSRQVTKQITYSLPLYEPESVTWARAQQAYEECVRRYGTGGIPPAAGVEAAQRNPEEGPCIPPHMKPMEGP
jgi:Domain of unknown function (DUF4157)